MDSAYPVNEKVNKMHSLILEILCDIEDFCKENGILYFLAGGTCLGAVRHSGFIPWDDDADLIMPRKDYERFFSTFTEKYGEKYGAANLDTDPGWIREHGRVWNKKTILRFKNIQVDEIGVFVDIFAIDGLPESRLARKLFFKKMKVLSTLKYSCIKNYFLEGEKYRALKKIVSVFTKPFGPRFFAKLMDRSARKYDYDSCRLVAASTAVNYGERETIEREHFASAVYLPFEGNELPVPVDYDAYLTNEYGDYMTIPEGAAEKGFTHLENWSIEFVD